MSYPPILKDTNGNAIPQYWATNPAGWVPISDANGEPVQGLGGSGGFADLLLTDSNSVLFIGRDNGGATPVLTYFRIDNGGSYTPVGTIAVAGATSNIVKIIPSTTAILTNVDSTVYEASHIVSAASATLLGLFGYNSKTSGQFIQLFDSATLPADASAPTIAPLWVPASSNFAIDFGIYGRYFSAGITVCDSSTGPTKTLGSADCWFSARIK